MKYSAIAPSKMSVNDLRNLVRVGEGKYLEFKREISSPENIAREISAFANTSGGKLIIGVDDDKTLRGIGSFYEQDFLLEKAFHDFCRPVPEYTLEIVRYKDREIAIVTVMEAKRKPIYVKDGTRRDAYIRMKDKSVKASPEMKDLMRKVSSGKDVTFEYGPTEQKLFRYLNEYQRITVAEFARFIDLPEKQARHILVNLTAAEILKLFNNEQGDYFCFAESTASN